MLKKYRIVVNGEVYEVEIEEVGSHGVPAIAAPVAPERVAAPVVRPATAPPTAPPVAKTAPTKSAAPAPAGAGAVTCPMPGTILQVKVRVGETVKYGQPVVILEAMKMENEIVATTSGTVQDIRVAKGATVNSGDVLVVIG